MNYGAVFFGAIGTIAETSDMQRRAFNDAFAEAGLDWHWSAEDYAPLLSIVGGANRIAAYADDRGEEVDAAAIHAAKSRLYQAALAQDGVDLRPGVVDLMAHARDSGTRLAWVTTTCRANIDAILEAAGAALGADDFDLIVDGSMVAKGKPDPACYALALAHFDLAADRALAIEDTPESMQAARAAGIRCAAFPGAMPPGTTWADVDMTVSNLNELVS